MSGHYIPIDIVDQLAPGGLRATEGTAMTQQRSNENATARQIAAFSRWLESTPSYVGKDPEAVVWRRIGKITEENGEVTEAWLGAIGENPRKGVTGCVDEVVHELLDVATVALGAVEHFTGFDGSAMDMLADHVAYVCERAGLAALAAGLSLQEEQE